MKIDLYSVISRFRVDRLLSHLHLCSTVCTHFWPAGPPPGGAPKIIKNWLQIASSQMVARAQLPVGGGFPHVLQETGLTQRAYILHFQRIIG